MKQLSEEGESYSALWFREIELQRARASVRGTRQVLLGSVCLTLYADREIRESAERKT